MKTVKLDIQLNLSLDIKVPSDIHTLDQVMEYEGVINKALAKRFNEGGIDVCRKIQFSDKKDNL